MATESKPKYPTKICPKCGKSIHSRSMSHPECGWVHSSSAEKPVSGPKQKKSKKISKMEAVRRILRESGVDTMPLEIQDLLRKNYKISMAVGVISNYKSSIINKPKDNGSAWSKPVQTVHVKTAPVKHHYASEGITLDDLQTVKDLTERLGHDEVGKLAAMFAK